jgi:hypothetical protein
VTGFGETEAETRSRLHNEQIFRAASEGARRARAIRWMWILGTVAGVGAVVTWAWRRWA